MMINSFNTAMPMMPTGVNRPQVMTTQTSAPISFSPTPTNINMIGTAPVGLNFFPMLSNWTSNVTQMAGTVAQNIGQGMGNAFVNFGQLGAGALSGVAVPPLNYAQNLNNTQPVQNTQTIPYTTSKRTPEQILQSVTAGIGQALQDLGSLITQQAPTMMLYGGAMGGASAVCPYMCAGMAATGAAMLLNQNQAQAA